MKAPGCAGVPGYRAPRSASSTDNPADDPETILLAVCALPRAVSPCTADFAASWPRSAPGHAACLKPSVAAIDAVRRGRRAYLRRARRRDSLLQSLRPLPDA